MIVATLELQLRMEGCASLKDKRRILRSLIQRLRNDFKVSVAEVDDQDLWGNATIGIAFVTSDAHLAEAVLQKCEQVVEANSEVEVHQVDRRIERI